jgi:benzoyl-CoA reductase/2-hydroxyglutaryl-CoA dehydratase subunit BcrC/BadD/HgdB
VYTQSQALSYSEYIGQINIMLSHPLTDWRKYAPAPKNSFFAGKKVYVVGPFLEDVAMLCHIEKAGLQIVGDNLTNSKRLLWSDYVFDKKTIFSDIAAHILKYQVSPTSNRFAVTWDKDFAEIKSKNVQGVIFIHPKFCEPYDYLFAMYSQRLENEGIPTLCVNTGNENISMLEAFSEMI